MNKALIKIEGNEKLTQDYNELIESSYPAEEFPKINKCLMSGEYFLVAKLYGETIGIIVLKKELKERIYLYIQVLAALPRKSRNDAIFSLIQNAKVYARKLGFREIHIVESRDPYIEILKQVNFKSVEEYFLLARDLASTPLFEPKRQIVVRRIARDIHTFVEAWNSIVSSASAGDFPDFPQITENYLEDKLQRYPNLDTEGWFIAFDKNEQCGLITVTKDGELGDLMVSKTHRSLGIGTALILETLKYLKNKRFERAKLSVRAKNMEALNSI